MPSESSHPSPVHPSASHNGSDHPASALTPDGAVGHIVPRCPRGQVPDLDLVFQDLTQLNLPVAREQIASASEAYQSLRDAIYHEGYEPAPGAAAIRGMPGLITYCLNAVVLGVLAIRDPMFREALRVSRAYYATEEDFEGTEPEANPEEE